MGRHLEEAAVESLAGSRGVHSRWSAYSYHGVSEICNSWIHAKVLHLRAGRSDCPSFLFYFAIHAEAEHGDDWNRLMCVRLPASITPIPFQL